MAKLFASERAYVCADRAVRTWGGRAYMRRNSAERLLRELRVDRIWEGTSEIQRVILANALVNLDMLVWTEGRQWTPGDLEALLTRGGFRDLRVERTFGYWSLASAVRAD